jgi:glycosyltransferase involved in cell wall biosynthesis
MHILYIHQHFATNASAGGTRSYDYARYLVRRGHRVTMLTGDFMLKDLPKTEAGGGGGLVRRFEVDGIEVVVVGVPYSNRMGFTQRMLSFLAFAGLSSVLAATIRDVDAIYATSTPLTVGLPALAGRLLRGRPYVFEVRDIWPEIPVQMGILKNPVLITTAEVAERTFYRFASKIVGISDGIVDKLSARGIARAKLEVIHTGVDFDLYDGIEPDRAALGALGLGGRTVAIYAGAVSTVNHLDYVLDAAEISLSDPRLGFLIVGEGRCREDLQRAAADRGLDNVVFAGAKPKEELRGITRACDLGIISALPLEVFLPAMPNKFFDYLAAGLPVVANYEAEHNRHLEANGCGGYVSADDPGELARFLARLADQPDLRAEMGARASNLARTRYDRRRLVGKMENVLETIAGT